MGDLVLVGISTWTKVLDLDDVTGSSDGDIDRTELTVGGGSSVFVEEGVNCESDRICVLDSEEVKE